MRVLIIYFICFVAFIIAFTMSNETDVKFKSIVLSMLVVILDNQIRIKEQLKNKL